MASNPPPRFCLIHGSAQGARGWDLLARELMAWGAKVATPQLPQVDEGALYFASEVARQTTAGEASPPLVVVAHSLSGLLLPLVPRYLPVARLVYLAAPIPKPQSTVPPPTSADQFDDCEDPRVRDWALTTLRPWSPLKLISEPSPLDAHPNLPTTYISATLDRSLNPAYWQNEARQILNVQPVLIHAGHSPHISHPRELAKILMQRKIKSRDRKGAVAPTPT